LFGDGFFGRLAALPPGLWSGPIDSGYGVHLVRIGENVPASAPRLEEVRETVLRDWKAEKSRELRDLHYRQLRERYVVEIRETDLAAPVANQ
jgi:parvulin-like peptidyl-prolyl isomerase